jgi:hypothetical protein
MNFNVTPQSGILIFLLCIYVGIVIINLFEKKEK